MTYVHQRHSGEGDLCVIPWVRTTLGREEFTLGVGICCWVYVCEYGSVGRRSEEDRTRHEQKQLEEGTHTTIRSRVTVANDIRDQPLHRPTPCRNSGQGVSRSGIVLCGSRSELYFQYAAQRII